MLTTYFDNVTSFSLFDIPAISSPRLQALPAAIFSFAMYHRDDLSQANSDSCSVSLASTTSWFELADRLIREGLDKCSNEAPPISLLRVMVIITFQKPIRPVGEKVWRALGQLVRIAYKLQLHQVDLKQDRDTAEDPNA